MSAITRCLSGVASGLVLVIGVLVGVAVADQDEPKGAKELTERGQRIDKVASTHSRASTVAARPHGRPPVMRESPWRSTHRRA